MTGILGAARRTRNRIRDPDGQTVTAALSGRVLVLGDGDLAALAIVRSLGRVGLEVHLASFEGSPITRRSKFVALATRSRPPADDEAGFVDALLRLLARRRSTW